MARPLFANELLNFERNSHAKESSFESSPALESSAMLKSSMSCNSPSKDDAFHISTEFENDISKHNKFVGCLNDGVKAAGRKTDSDKDDVADNIVEMPERGKRKTILERSSCKLESNQVSNSEKTAACTEREATESRNFTVDYVDTSLMSPLHGSVEQAIAALSPMADEPKYCSPGRSRISRTLICMCYKVTQKRLNNTRNILVISY